MIDGDIPPDRVKPGLKRAILSELRSFGVDLYESIFHQILCCMDVADVTVQIHHQSVLVFSDNLNKAFVVTIQKTAVATCTVIHRSLISSSYLHYKRYRTKKLSFKEKMIASISKARVLSNGI